MLVQKLQQTLEKHKTLHAMLKLGQTADLTACPAVAVAAAADAALHILNILGNVIQLKLRGQPGQLLQEAAEGGELTDWLLLRSDQPCDVPGSTRDEVRKHFAFILQSTDHVSERDLLKYCG
ncbi:hypothetical protein PAMA_018647 [Pampus argenteus]